ncbi:MAG: hypothetical protein ABI707_09825 [Ferruginibacter sp.]
MKKIFLLSYIVFLAGILCKAQVKIGTNPAAVNSAAILELESNNKGLLLPRMADADMRGILNPPKGLTVFNITDSSVYFRRDSGWTRLGTTTGSAFYAALQINQSIPNYTFTTLLPYFEYYDEGSNFDPATGIFRARDAGIYHFEMSIVVPPQPSNTAYGVETFINGGISSQKFQIAPSFGASFNSSLQFTFDVKLYASDNYSFTFLQRTGTTMNLQGANSVESTYFSGFKVF